MSTHIANIRTHENAALRAFVAELQKRFAADVHQVILFGSAARGETASESDIDLLIVVDKDSWDLQTRIDELSVETDLAYDVVVSDMIISAERFQEMRQQREPLYKNIEREGITLWQRESATSPTT